MEALAARSPVVVLGSVTRVAASEEPLLASSRATVVIKIQRMFAGSEFAGDQTGRIATVILSEPRSLKVGSEVLFFGNPRFIGKTLTIADEGELPAPRIEVGEIPVALARGIQARRDAPVRARLALAALVFRGTVESVRPAENSEEKAAEPRTEHDPEWQLAVVRVTRGVRGVKDGDVIPIIFSASRDIVWFNSPKLQTGGQILVLAHPPQEDELRLLRGARISSLVKEQRAFIVSQPYDVLPVQDEKRLSILVQAKEVQ
jgi:hypothetical protein